MSKRLISKGLELRVGQNDRFKSSFNSSPLASEELETQVVWGDVIENLPHVNEAISFTSPL